MQGDDRAKLVEALGFALDAHGAQTRKGSAVPYASHLLEVSGLVLEHGGNIDQAVAGLLHDVLEDCEQVDEAALRRRFGDEVARIVGSCSDVLEGDTTTEKSPWPIRKNLYIEKLRAADDRVRLVAAWDKLQNLRCLIADLRQGGVETLLDRFNATPAQTRWYYEEVRGALGADLPERLLSELDALLGELGRFVPRASREG
ncbi:MAG TPA: HD domain-containing protein [Myxococcota bacterium]